MNNLPSEYVNIVTLRLLEFIFLSVMAYTVISYLVSSSRLLMLTVVPFTLIFPPRAYLA